ncbi:class I SAM-dependent methyltransferase [Halegenticoccus tardaugens]|uniref:class I SAM-dependent methyltransferase n=1 Tax=Halegenticoccus tardaugens TaxID=2071624 RepID=UPI00100B7171|nr:class I SAM-dependent methyltransferase [Halegenticoccus tardaugens]
MSEHEHAAGPTVDPEAAATFGRWLLRTVEYDDPAKLNARLRLRESFGTRETGWYEWVFDRFDLPRSARVLELGCGPGHLWAANRDRIPAGWECVLTDFSPPMLDAAREALRDAAGFGFGVADAERPPFADDSFDAVVANHVLYHVPDVDAALAEIDRVLRPGGRLYASTRGEADSRELHDFLSPFVEAPLDAPGRFTLENGASRLERRFDSVSTHRRRETLRVTRVDPLVEYASSRSEIDDGALCDVAAAAEGAISADGALDVTKDAGLFVAEASGA